MLLTLAGCLGNNEPHDQGEPDDSTGGRDGNGGDGDPDEGSGGDPITPHTDGNGTYPSQAHWTDCQASSTAFFWPGQPEGFPRPPGWMPPETRPYARVFMQIFDCNRVSLGQFERPVRMLIESHNSGENPPSCNSESDLTIQHELINSFWVNDTEVASYLEQTYGLPVYVSDIRIESKPLPGTGNEYTITWGDNQPSWFSTTDDIGHQGETRTNFRFFWYNGTVLGAMDFFLFSSNDDTADNPAVGKMYDPMLMSRLGEDYTSIGMWYPETRMDSPSIELYKDLACKEPL